MILKDVKESVGNRQGCLEERERASEVQTPGGIGSITVQVFSRSLAGERKERHHGRAPGTLQGKG